MTEIFTHKEFSLEYLRLGNGPKTMLYFHGFGSNCQEIYAYESEQIKHLTVYSFSFFHHGKSVYPKSKIDKETLTAQDLYDVFNAFLLEKQIERFSLMGFSMGGKICLQLLHGFAGRIDFIILSAPDGVKKNFWYSFTSNNPIGNRIYRHSIRKPGLVLKTASALRGMRILSRKIHDFARLNLETEEKRIHVYNVWMTLRKINPELKKSSELINVNRIRLCLNYGRYDKVITLKTGRRFHAMTKSNSILNVIEKGHNLAHPLTGQYIDEFLKEF